MIFNQDQAKRVTPENVIQAYNEVNGKFPGLSVSWPIVESNYLYTEKYTERTWWERLFNTYHGKWQPFRRGYTTRIPDPMVYMVRDFNGKITLVAHPATVLKLKEQLNATAQEK